MSNFKVTNQEAGLRIDVYLAAKLKLSRAKTQQLIARGLVFVNDKNRSKHFRLKTGEQIRVKKTVKTVKKLNFKLTVVASSLDFVVVDKPAGIVVHPDNAHPPGTSLVDAVVAKFPEIKAVGEDMLRPGIVHRLDKNVSGLLVVARNKAMFDSLKIQFKNRQVVKRYTALVHGLVKKSMVIKQPLARNKKGLFRVSRLGKSAYTEIKILQKFKQFTLVEVSIKTGRTHQIKTHLHSIGHPLVGEMLYGNKKSRSTKLNIKLERPFLHAAYLSFNDLADQKKVFISELPGELKIFLSTLTETQ